MAPFSLLGHQANKFGIGEFAAVNSELAQFLRTDSSQTFWITSPFAGAFQRKRFGPGGGKGAARL